MLSTWRSAGPAVPDGSLPLVLHVELYLREERGVICGQARLLAHAIGDPNLRNTKSLFEGLARLTRKRRALAAPTLPFRFGAAPAPPRLTSILAKAVPSAPGCSDRPRTRAG
jgi:hypothetical protein